MQPRFLIVDSTLDSASLIRSQLASVGFHDVRIECRYGQTIHPFEPQTRFDIALIDGGLFKDGGRELIEEILTANPTVEVIVVADAESALAAFQCLGYGAYDCLMKPFISWQLDSMVRRAVERKRLLDVFQAERCMQPSEVESSTAFKNIVSTSGLFLRLLRAAEVLGAGEVPILISGEIGTGKRLLARAIHEVRPGAEYSFIAMDSASLGLSEIEEVFSDQKSAISDGVMPLPAGQRKGNQTTVFLDRIEHLSDPMQARLLELVQNCGLSLSGNGNRKTIDARLVATASTDIAEMARVGKFRQNLFRLFRGSWLHLPPLRERREDILPLSRFFLERWEQSSEAWSLEETAVAALLGYDFPGNVDELQAVLRAAIAQAQGRSISAACLPDYVQRSTSMMVGVLPPGGPAMPLADLEKRYILNLYAQMNHNKVRTARALGIGLNTVRRKLKSYGFK
jgi:two-component system response regulator AtoC